MMKEKQRQWLRYFMLGIGMILLVSIVFPHHHHRDGKACYVPFLTEEAAEGDHETDPHDCGCHGHNLALFKSSPASAAPGNDLVLHPLPIAFLFDWVWSATSTLRKCSSERRERPYIESLHGVWIVVAAGLRAPPVVL